MLEIIFDVVDAVVELYLKNVISPFLKLHEKFYSKLNTLLRSLIEKKGLPEWCTANFITYARTFLIIPCLILLSKGHTIIPSMIVILVDFGDFLDGVVARYWSDLKKIEKKILQEKESNVLPSWITRHRNDTFGGFVDAVCDKAFVVPCWIFLLSSVESSRIFVKVQYITLWCLILAETASGSIRFRAFYTSGGLPTPKVENLNFSSSAVKADHIGKAKQTFEMVGTALFILSSSRLFGLILLLCAVPLAYESVRRKVNTRLIYVDGTVAKFDHRAIKFWIQAKSLGSKLLVGVSSQNVGNVDDMILNARASASVDEVISRVPKVIDMSFLQRNNISFILCAQGSEALKVDDDVLDAGKCLLLTFDGIVKPMKPKGSRKD